jgi:EAL domain-containing protein (putative c-di-GMP-specific phosphodiesterase class I)
MGIRLSIDDFGTGYSSLAYLRRMPITEIKIDRSFVSNLVTSQNDAIIVRSTIELAKNLGLEVVAEGVEDAATCALLARWGCDFVQGYFLARPLPELEFAAKLDELPAWWSTWSDASAEVNALP